MGRHKQCSSCLYFMKMPKELQFANTSVVFDGWCKHYEEERDRDEEICEAYKQMIYRKVVQDSAPRRRRA